MQLKTLLQMLSQSTRLHVNYSNSSIVPINISNERANYLTKSFGCKTETLPFTYLVLPLGTTKPSVQDLIPIIARIDKKLYGIANFMNYVGRLTYVNSVITVLDHVNKSSKTFLWHGNDIDRKRNYMDNGR